MYKTNGSSLTLIADTQGPIGNFDNYITVDGVGSTPVIKDDGTVIFRAYHDDGRRAIYSGNGGPLTLIADSSGPLKELNQPSVNALGDITFTASFDAGGEAILRKPATGADPGA